jgi:hypothetical protein
MKHTLRRVLAVPLLVLGAAACGSSSTDDPVVVDPGLTVAGLKFTLAGATLTEVSAALPASDASFAAPIVTVDHAPTATQAATISVSAAEPFQTILVQPTGNASYVRIFLPAQTTLIGVTVLANPSGSASVATSITAAVANGARVSKTTALALQAISN